MGDKFGIADRRGTGGRGRGAARGEAKRQDNSNRSTHQPGIVGNDGFGKPGACGGKTRISSCDCAWGCVMIAAAPAMAMSANSTPMTSAIQGAGLRGDL